jgi:hypothetical protein
MFALDDDDDVDAGVSTGRISMNCRDDDDDAGVAAGDDNTACVAAGDVDDAPDRAHADDSFFAAAEVVAGDDGAARDGHATGGTAATDVLPGKNGLAVDERPDDGVIGRRSAGTLANVAQLAAPVNCFAAAAAAAAAFATALSSFRDSAIIARSSSTMPMLSLPPADEEPRVAICE